MACARHALLWACLCMPLTAVGQGLQGLWGGVDLSATSGGSYLNWSTAGPGYFPNVLSELTWRNVRHSGGRLEAWVGLGALAGGLSVSSSNITDGRSQDSDYGADDRQSEFSRSVHDTHGDGAGSWLLSAGWAPPWLNYRGWQLQVLGGYGRQWLDLRLTNGEQTVSEPGNVPAGWTFVPAPLGPIPGLNSTYTAIWYGPFLGGSLQGRVLNHLHLSAEYRYHLARYYGWGNWNLSTRFKHPKSYDHLAWGSGKVLRLRAAVPVGPVDFYLASEHHYWETVEGDSRFYLSDNTVPVQPLNPVVQRGWVVSIGVSVVIR